MKRVTVHIDRLVLKGFRHEDRHDMAEGLRQELGYLLAEPSVARRLISRGDSACLKVGNVRITSLPIRIGAHAARNIAHEIQS